jgi:hypothetical protein
MAKMLVLLTLALLLGACSQRLEGTYEDDVGFMRFTFHDDGRVVHSTLGFEVEMRYERNGDRIVVDTPDEDVVLVRVDDRTLEGPDGMRLSRTD